MQKIMNIFRWAVTVFFLLMMVTGGISAVFFGLALLLTVPIKKLIDEVIVMGYDSCGNCHPQQEYPILLEECSIMNSKLAALILTIAVSLSMLSCQKEMSGN